MTFPSPVINGLSGFEVCLTDNSGLDQYSKWQTGVSVIKDNLTLSVKQESFKYKKIKAELRATDTKSNIKLVIGKFEAMKKDTSGNSGRHRIEVSINVHIKHQFRDKGCARFLCRTIGKEFPSFFQGKSVCKAVSSWYAPSASPSQGFSELYFDFMNEHFFEMEFTNPGRVAVYDFQRFHYEPQLPAFPLPEDMQKAMMESFSSKMFKEIFKNKKRLEVECVRVKIGSYVKASFKLNGLRGRPPHKRQRVVLD